MNVEINLITYTRNFTLQIHLKPIELINPSYMDHSISVFFRDQSNFFSYIHVVSINVDPRK